MKSKLMRSRLFGGQSRRAKAYSIAWPILLFGRTADTCLSSISRRPGLPDRLLDAFFLALLRSEFRLVRLRLHLVQLADVDDGLDGVSFIRVQSFDELAAQMGPASVQGDPGLLFELVICSIPVSLDIAFIAAQQLARHACGTAAPVIIEHDITAQAVKDAPFITLSGLVFLIVYDRYGTLVHMDMLALEYLLTKDVIQEPSLSTAASYQSPIVESLIVIPASLYCCIWQ